jgi:hypothetical protein
VKWRRVACLLAKEQQGHQGVTDVRSQLIVLLCFVDWLGGDLSTRNAVEHGVAPVRKHVRCDEGLVEKVAHTLHRCIGVGGEVLVPERREWMEESERKRVSGRE